MIEPAGLVLAPYAELRGFVVAIVPIKPFAVAKSRLGELDPSARISLARQMASATLCALRGARSVGRVLVVTADADAAKLACRLGAEVVADTGGGLDAAWRAGMAVAGLGVRLLIPGDFLNIDAGDIDGLVESFLDGAMRPIGLLACQHRDSTNAVLLAAGAQFEPRFGPGSFVRHWAEAGASAIELQSPVLAIDIDTPVDLTLARRGAAARMHSAARALRDRGFDNLLTYSPKVFLPLTRLCRDVCHYCTFATVPGKLAAPFMSVDEAVAIATKGSAHGCREALLTLGEKPELRWQEARAWLDERGHASTIHYVAEVAAAVRDRTGLLPHVNAGCLSAEDLALLRPVSASMGLMLESAAERLCERGGPHYGSPDKHPAPRLATLEEAGRQAIPFTTGILIGIGETAEERVEALEAIAAIHARHGHIQEIIVQNFVPKPDTKMARVAPASLEDLCLTIAEARRIFGAEMSIQAPPNLNGEGLAELIHAGINDWGGISPVTIDHVNPESPWPEIDALREICAGAGKQLAPRLTIYPGYAADAERWLDPAMRRFVLDQSDGMGLAREDAWVSGMSNAIPAGALPRSAARSGRIGRILKRISEEGAEALPDTEIVTLLEARDTDFHAVCEAADALRQTVNGEVASYVVNRNINYTNICTFTCRFCAFSKGNRKHAGGEAAYLLDFDEIGRRAGEAAERGATEVCLQGGIHPHFTGETYLEIVRALRAAVPAIHIHAFSPLEIAHGARTTGIPLDDYLALLRREGLGSLPGTAAEILDDEVRRVLCPDKLTTAEWFEVIDAAHSVGLATTATIMFGHVDGYRHWARHLARIRAQQVRSLSLGFGGFTEFVPLSFVAAEAPIYRKGGARRGPTLREAILMHAVSRLVLHPVIPNIQASWVKLGRGGMARAMQAGANDMGGILMNESITRAAGATHGQEMAVSAMKSMANEVGRRPEQRTTLYGRAQMAKL